MTRSLRRRRQALITGNCRPRLEWSDQRHDVCDVILPAPLKKTERNTAATRLEPALRKPPGVISVVGTRRSSPSVAGSVLCEPFESGTLSGPSQMLVRWWNRIWWPLTFRRLSRLARLKRLSLGTASERIAAAYLASRGLRIVARNFRSEHGEVDLVAVDGNELVFVEVKSRRLPAPEAPERNVSARKQKRLRAVARDFLVRHRLQSKQIRCRFDVVAVLWSRELSRISIRHIRDAFPPGDRTH